ALAALAACCTPAARAEAEAAAAELEGARKALLAVLPDGVQVVGDPRSSCVLLRVPHGAPVHARLREAGFAVRRGDTFPGLSAALAVFAGDHGVHAQGVTPWPQEVTAQMVANFVAGGAVVSAFAAQLGADVVVVDVGVAAPLDPAPGLLDRKVRAGTADLAVGPAMTVDEGRRAVEVGIEVATALAAEHGCLVTGDMGI